jgi:hypothetical protein
MFTSNLINGVWQSRNDLISYFVITGTPASIVCGTQAKETRRADVCFASRGAKII